jgi:hypothetical protein
VDTLCELRERLGGYRIGAGRELRWLADAIAGERVEAVLVGLRGRRGWVIAATDRGLRMARRPRLLGRPRDAAWDWSELTEVRSGVQRVDLVFGPERVELRFLGPHDEFARLLDTARRALPDAPETATEELRELAQLKLGRALAFGFEPAIDALPDRLGPGEYVQRLAVARLDFTGLLVVTNRRVLLFAVGMTREGEHLWELDRARLSGAQAEGDDLRLQLSESAVTLAAVQPPERAAELAAALWRG